VTEDFCDARDWLAWGTQHHNAGAEAASSLFCHHRRAPLFPTCCSSTGVGDIVRQTTRTTDCSTVMPGSPLVDVKESLTRSACSSPFSANMFPACGFPEGAAKRRDPRAVRLRGRRPGAPTDGERGGPRAQGIRVCRTGLRWHRGVGLSLAPRRSGGGPASAARHQVHLPSWTRSERSRDAFGRRLRSCGRTLGPAVHAALRRPKSMKIAVVPAGP
jgi:hypothetical protein